ncbi:hypothetical protein BDA96_02G078700 [Sorghum bicolor]|uniref:BHLH domain-containing protein n=2 Tax=Sorghum bicolor TaxID=4558 RepID=A0A1W0W2V5_SORBI|nr:hypothetical protein BDA96_02G078700 [Sorghum bicolor]OQU88698.1 hypothetical protein SORBI_3002G076600 [Sorghum bicolor]OQU88700.1 hypothetical protein SORBI_3002G076600 [Sorghum bicolor]
MSMKLKLYIDIPKVLLPSLPHDRELKVLINSPFVTLFMWSITNICGNKYQSAGIQTVACIPVNDGVLEIGTTEKVEEDIGLIQYARSIFMDQIGAHIMPTLSGHSTSTAPTTHINHQPFQTKMGCIGDINVQKTSHNSGDEHHNEMEDDGDVRIDLLQTNTGNDSSRHSPQDTNVGNEQGTLNAGSSELMLTGTSERVRDGCSKQEDEEIPVLMVCQNNGNLVAQDEFGPWHDFVDEDLSSKYLQSSAAEDQAVLAENAHYVETVLAILRFNASRQTQAASSNTKAYLALSKNSSFSRWTTSWNHKASNNDLQSMLIPDDEGAPQRLLKSILLGAPSSSSHPSYKGADAAVHSSPEPRDDGEGTSRSRRAPPVQPAELSASHVLKERRRREKLNERFVMLRSLVPFVTKMDRASILGDTIEYVKQLRRRIQELESSRGRLVDSNPRTTAMAPPPPPPAASTETTRRGHHTSGGYLARAGTGTGTGTAAEASASGSCCNSSVGEHEHHLAGDTEVQVSIIGSDALLELRCPHREGLLLRVMQALHQELRLEVTSVQASSAGDVLLAELRAKVKEVHGRRSSITEVKRAIHLIVSSD